VGSDNFFRRFFGRPFWPSPQVRCALGSRLLISVGAEILTNNHVVAGADEMRVGLFGDERKSSVAAVVGRDPLTDSALTNAPRDLAHAR
jgi:serine protease DegS